MKRSIEETVDSDEDNDLWHQISVACYKQYDSFPSRGKPSSNEWTHLAGVVSFDKQTKEVRVLSLGTGTKCLGGTKDERGTEGCLLHDSHAEIIARRSLLRLFYEEILSKRDSLLIPIEEQEKKYQLKESLCLYMFVSSPPCGLAAHVADPIKRPRLEHKSLHSVDADLFLKPGKGSATTSLSCTNKIKRWISQGRLVQQREKRNVSVSSFNQVWKADCWISSCPRRFDCRVWSSRQLLISQLYSLLFRCIR